MSESGSGKMDDLKARLKDAVSGKDGEIDADSVMAGLRDAVGKAGSDVDPEALMARAKEFAGKAEGKVDTEKLRQWIDEVDTGKLRDWLDEAKTLSAGAASMVETHGERLAEHAPGAFDKLVGAAKERIGALTGNEDLTHAGELDRLKGQIKESFAGAADSAGDEVKAAADAVKKSP